MSRTSKVRPKRINTSIRIDEQVHRWLLRRRERTGVGIGRYLEILVRAAAVAEKKAREPRSPSQP